MGKHRTAREQEVGQINKQKNTRTISHSSNMYVFGTKPLHFVNIYIDADF